MATAKNGDTVKVHFTGKLKDGTIFDESKEHGGPLEFTIGEGQIITGFEQAVIGMKPGETRTTQIAPEDAYGQRWDDRVAVVERNSLPEDLDVDVGQLLEIHHEDGKVSVVQVTGLSDDTVTLDGNHPLAGKELTFDIELLEIA